MPAFTAADGTRLAYHLLGKDDAHNGRGPLLRLPGGPMRASAYLGDLGGLGRRRQLALLDLRGTGESQAPADRTTYRCDRQAADVEALRAHLALDRVDLLAHSAGGDLALLYAVRHPDRVRSLTLVAGRARALGVDFTVTQRRQAAAERAHEPWFAAAHESFERVWAGTATDADHDTAAPFFYGRWDAAARAHAAQEAAQCNDSAADRYASPAAFDPEGARAVLSDWDAPVLVLAGALDGGPLPRVAATIAGLFRRAELVVQPGSGHYPWIDDPDRFSETVTRFLSGPAPGAR